MKNMQQVNHNGATAEFRENGGEAELLLNGAVITSSSGAARQAAHAADHAAMTGYAATAFDANDRPTTWTADGLTYTLATYNDDGSINTVTINGVAYVATYTGGTGTAFNGFVEV